MVTQLIIAVIVLVIGCIFLAIKAFPKQKGRIIKAIFASIFAAFVYLVVHPNLVSMSSITCEALMESEGRNVAALINDYFAIPSHTKMPTFEDLSKSGYVPPEERESPRKSYSVKESDMVVLVKGDPYDEIEIWVVAGKDRCNAGRAWVYYMSRQDGEWLD